MNSDLALVGHVLRSDGSPQQTHIDNCFRTGDLGSEGQLNLIGQGRFEDFMEIIFVTHNSSLGQSPNSVVLDPNVRLVVPHESHVYGVQLFVANSSVCNLSLNPDQSYVHQYFQTKLGYIYQVRSVDTYVSLA